MTEDIRAKGIRPLVIAGAVVLLVLSVVYASNVSSKAAYLTQRNHRILANLGKGVESRINHVARVFRTVRTIQAREKTVDPASFDLACVTHFAEHGDGGSEEGEVERHGPAGHEHSVGGSGDAPSEESGGLHVHAADDLPEIVNLGGSLEFLHRSADHRELHAQPDPDCLLGWLGESDVFDHVALLDGSGRSSFQTGRSGVKLREVPAGEGQQKAEGRMVRLPWEDGLKEPEIHLAGSTYRVYTYPLTLDFAERGPGSEDGAVRRAEWELVGLVRTDRLWGEALRLDSSILSGLVYALFLAAFSWPFVRLWALGPNERLRPHLVILTCLAMTAATGMLTVAVADLAAYRGLQARVSGELRDTAIDVRAAFEDELRDALAAARDLEARLSPAAARHCAGEGPPLHGRLLESRPRLRYPHLEMIFWMNPDGEQCAKWSVQDQATPLLPVRDRGYFRNVRAGNLWKLPHDPGRGFALESVHSRNSGATLAVLGLPVSDGGGEPPVLGAYAVGLRFPSLLRPVLPPARHLAVLDATGLVLFHSRPERAGAEDFLRETEGAPELKAVLFAGADRGLDAPYWGRDRQMYTTALSGVPWRLVVYQDKDLLRSLNLEVIASALALFAIHLVLLGLGAGVLVTIGLGRSGSMLDGRHAGRLLRAATVFSAVGAALGLVIVHLPSGLLALPALALPLAGLGLALATLVQGGRGPRLQQAAGVGVGVFCLAVFAVWLRSIEVPASPDLALTVLLGIAFLLAVFDKDLPIRTRRLHVLSLASLGTAALVALAVLPALGFFLAVQEERLDREVRRGQLHLVRSLENRTARIGAAAREVPGLGTHLNHLLCDDRDVHFRSYFGTRYRQYVSERDGLVPCFGTPATGAEPLRATSRSGRGGTDTVIAPWADRLPSEVARTVALHLPVNDHLVQSLLIAGDPAPAPKSGTRWRRVERTLRLDLFGPSGPGKRLSIFSSVPSVTPDRGVETVLAGLGGLLLVGLGLWLLDRRLLVVGRTATPTACLQDLRAGAFQRLLVVHPPGADLGAVRPEAALHLDLAAGGGAEALSALVEASDDAEDGDLVSVQGVETAAFDPALRTAMRSAADRLSTQRRLRVLLFCATDPEPVLGSPPDGPDEPPEGSDASSLPSLDRFRVEWCSDPAGRGALRRQRFDQPLRAAVERLGDGGSGWNRWFERWSGRRRLAIVRRECRWTRPLQDVGLALARRPDFGRLDPARIPELIRREAGEHYHALWRALSPAQRHVLAQLTRRALVNPGQRRTAERLAAWNLIVPRPTLRPMSRSFCRFVEEVHDPVELRRWEAAGTSPLWRELRLPMAILFATVAAFLVITQREFFDVAIAVVSAAAAGIPALLRMIDGTRKWIVGRASGGGAAA